MNGWIIITQRMSMDLNIFTLREVLKNNLSIF